MLRVLYRVLAVAFTAGTATSCSRAPATQRGVATPSPAQPATPSPIAASCCGKERYGPYFPEQPEDAPANGRDNRTGWWKPYLAKEMATWSEPPLWNCGRQVGPDTLRVLPYWGGQAMPQVVRIEHANGRATAYARDVVMGEEREAVVEASAALSDADWDSLAACLGRTSFWNAHSRRIMNMMMDGGTDLLEASIGGRYNVLANTAGSKPPAPAAFECMELALHLTEPVRQTARERLEEQLCAWSRADRPAARWPDRPFLTESPSCP